MHVTWWVLTATVDHFLFANEDTNSGRLRLNDQKWLNGSQDSSPRHSTAAPEHSREDTKNALGYIFKGDAAILTEGVMCCLLPSWHRLETFVNPLHPHICFDSPRTLIHSGDPVWERPKFPIASGITKPFSTRSLRARPLKKYVINSPSKQSHSFPLRPLCYKQR